MTVRFHKVAKAILYLLLFSFLLFDLGFSFLQHYSQPLDGDLAESVLPSEAMKPLFACPSGINVIVKDTSYHNPNRFFSHWFLNKYFNHVPHLLQKFVEPIDSVYLASAIFKTLIQLMLLVLLSIAIVGNTQVFKFDFLLAATLITPLFQTNGYRGYMGIIDTSITYTFFYAFPLALLLLFLIPFILKNYYHRTAVNQFIKVFLWIPLGIVISLSGPLNPGIVLIFSALVFLQKIVLNLRHSTLSPFSKKLLNSIFSVPKNYWFYLVPLSLFSLYSIYIGSFNSSNLAHKVPLAELYSKLPKGIYYQFTQKLGFPVLFFILALNTVFIVLKYRSIEGDKIIRTFKWIGIFSLLYILLLPLGGYRDYREYILRYDTIMPITISLLFIFGISTMYLLKKSTNRQKVWYLPLIIGVLFIFLNSDEAKFDKNECERMALKKISTSPTRVVLLDADCTVVSWDKFKNPEESFDNASLLQKLGITKEIKYYYHR